MSQCSDSRPGPDALVWTATTPAPRNDIFNVTNGEVCDWRYLWPAISDTLGLQNAGDTPRLMSEFLPAHEHVWARVVARHGLQPLSLFDVLADTALAVVHSAKRPGRGRDRGQGPSQSGSLAPWPGSLIARAK